MKREGRAARAARDERGMALMVAMITLLLLSSLGYLSMAAALFERQATMSTTIQNAVYGAATACLDMVQELLRKKQYNAYDGSNVLFIPNSTDPSATVVRHPIVGDCRLIESNCMGGTGGGTDYGGGPEAETYSCCRTGYAVDGYRAPFAFDRTDANHYARIPVSLKGNLAAQMTGGYAEVLRGDRIVSHAQVITMLPLMGSEDFYYERYEVTITAVCGMAIMEYQAGVARGPYQRKGGAGSGGPGTVY